MQRNRIKELGADLQVEESTTTVCPFCEAHHERSFSITRTITGLLYNCFRASCAKHGIVADISKRTDSSEFRKSKFRSYAGILEEMGIQQIVEIFEPYGLSAKEIRRQGIRYARNDKRIYFPIYDYRGFQIGENLRSIDPNVNPKALINRWGDVPLIHFPIGQHSSDILVIVEDQLSSIKVAAVAQCAALLGTNLTEEGLSLFRKIGLKKLVLMLDGDTAGRKATLKLENKLKSFFEVRSIFLPEGYDPKDLEYSELEELLNVKIT